MQAMENPKRSADGLSAQGTLAGYELVEHPLSNGNEVHVL